MLQPGYHCIYRPDRTSPRLFTKRDAARIYCRVAVREPFPFEEFEALVQEYCPGVRVKPPTDWERRLRDAIDVIEAVVKFLVTVIGRWKQIKKVLQRAITYLPQPFRRVVERVVAEGVALIEQLAEDAATALKGVIDSLLRLLRSSRF